MSENNITPRSYYQPLFDLLHHEHGLTPLESEMADIIHVVERMQEQSAQIAFYELRLALYNMIKVTKALIDNRGTLLNARKRIEAADTILKKHFKITDVLRDESGTPAAEIEKPTLTQSRADFIREVNDRDMEGMEVIEFAEWAPTIAFFDDEYRLWELLKEGEFINGQFRFTTKELYKLFKQQKEKR